MLRLILPVLALVGAPALAQTTATPPAGAPMTTNPMTPAPQTMPMPQTAPMAGAPMADPAAAPAPELTDKERSQLTRCSRLTAQEQAQSSKCQAVMKKAGKGDPATQRQTSPNVAPN